jgi:hypothetical protein
LLYRFQHNFLLLCSPIQLLSKNLLSARVKRKHARTVDTRADKRKVHLALSSTDNRVFVRFSQHPAKLINLVLADTIITGGCLSAKMFWPWGVCKYPKKKISVITLGVLRHYQYYRYCSPTVETGEEGTPKWSVEEGTLLCAFCLPGNFIPV